MSESVSNFDVLVIGGGPGGYVTAIKAAQLGFKTACVEKRKFLGGTCLNVGCIPSKALLHSSKLFHEAQHEFSKHGITASGLKIDFSQMMNNKEEVISNLASGIDMLFKKNKITKIEGEAQLQKDGSVLVSGKTNVNATHIIIATGSDIMSLPNIDIDEQNIISSTGALSLKKVPKSMLVVGGGYIGLEMGSVFARLGCKVSVVEFADSIVPAMDKEISKKFKTILEKQGLEFTMSTKLVEAKTNKGEVEVKLEPAKGGASSKAKFEKVLIAIGRRPYTDNLGLENIGVECDNRGYIKVDHNFATAKKGVFAIGDVIPGPMLAHKAEEEGVALVEMLAGQAGHVNYDAIAGVVYTEPEVATVGKTEEELKQAGIAYKTGKFNFMANSRARAMLMTDGFVKVLACDKTDKVLGVHIIGPDAGHLIAEAVTTIEYGGSAEDIARTCHAHPTLSEAVKEAALDVDNKAIHS